MNKHSSEVFLLIFLQQQGRLLLTYKAKWFVWISCIKANRLSWFWLFFHFTSTEIEALVCLAFEPTGNANMWMHSIVTTESVRSKMYAMMVWIGAMHPIHITFHFPLKRLTWRSTSCKFRSNSHLCITRYIDIHVISVMRLRLNEHYHHLFFFLRRKTSLTYTHRCWYEMRWNIKYAMHNDKVSVLFKEYVPHVTSKVLTLC